MNRRSPIILILMLVFVFSPVVANWILDANGAWYRPFLVWAGVVFVAYLVQRTLVKKYGD